MKRKMNLALFLISLLYITFFANADKPISWSQYGSTPSDIVESIADMANEENATEVQDTRLNNINNTPSGGIWKRYQISNTFIWLTKDKDGLAPYIQWTIYIWMVAATILLAWNWFLLVTGRKINDAKENIKYIVLWVIIMTGFYVVIAIVTAILNYFFA